MRRGKRMVRGRSSRGQCYKYDTDTDTLITGLGGEEEKGEKTEGEEDADKAGHGDAFPTWHPGKELTDEKTVVSIRQSGDMSTECE